MKCSNCGASIAVGSSTAGHYCEPNTINDSAIPKIIADQPPPQANETKPVWEIIVEDVQKNLTHFPHINELLTDMKERDQVGRARYGMPLQIKNGRDALIDAYQEALDACAYTRQHLEETKDADIALIARDLFWKAVLLALAIRKAISDRSLSK